VVRGIKEKGVKQMSIKQGLHVHKFIFWLFM